jgi:L-phenylalanine/L-methionine N-acetyltransferase
MSADAQARKVKVGFRGARMSDLGRLREIVNDPQVAKYLTVAPPVTEKSTREFIREYSRPGRILRIVTADGRVAGSVSLRLNPPGSKRRHVADFGISLARDFWGMGVGGAALDHVIKIAWGKGVKRLELSVAADNRRARRLYRSRGFEVEGRKRKDYLRGGRYYDALIMARFLR